MNVLVIDHRDSFVFNLVEDLERCGARCEIVRSEISLGSLERVIGERSPELVVLSPGPGRPEEAGVMLPFLRSDPEVPILGVCLGMQAIAIAAGAVVAPTRASRHGRSSRVRHERDRVFDQIESGFLAGRYHSLAIAEPSPRVETIAWSEDDETVMAIRDRDRNRVGLQFHPESILTPSGSTILRNILVEASSGRLVPPIGGPHESA